MTDVTRAQSFGAVSEHYDRYRPGPPEQALDWLLPDGAQAALDVGAGTGALTRLLVARVADVTAVDPDERMRRVLADRVPAATVLAGQAEALPVADGSQDAVLASSAWHWVDPERAVPEAARVLRPGGRLGVLWSGPDRESEIVRDLWSTLRPTPGEPALRRPHRTLVLPDGVPFAAPEGPHLVRFRRRFTREELLGLAGTFSRVIVLEPSARAELLDRVRASLAADPRLDEPDGIELPMTSRCWRAERR
jgi:SAM-dependent methyltransferase